MNRYNVTQVMNKKQISLILVAGLLCGTANAVVNLEATGAEGSPVGTVMIANENEIDRDNGTQVSGTPYNVTGKSGFIIPSGSTFYIRIDLSGSATFMTDPSGQFTPSANRASGGAGDNYVILSLPGPVADDADWTLNGVTYLLKDKAHVDISYKLYENASDALIGEEDSALASDSAAFIRFADATSMAGKASTPAKIDVATSSTRFENGLVTHIMEINIKNVVGNQIATGDAGTDIVLDRVVDKITLTATGDFSAVAAIKDADDKVLLEAGKIWLDVDDTCTPEIGGTDRNNDGDFDDPSDIAPIPAGHQIGALATFNDEYLEATVVITNEDNVQNIPTDPAYLGNIENAFLCMQINGLSKIPEFTYKGKLSMTAKDNYEAIGDVSFTGSRLEKNRETAVLQFLVTPEGDFRNMVRLTNTSNFEGTDLMVTLINDAGDEVTFSLGDVPGVSADLAPRASTPLININVLYATAQKVERGDKGTFTVEGEGMGNKLRARFDGNVLAGSLKAQALSVSTDNTTFFTF